MKRILIFSLAYYPHVGGAEVSIKEITDRISDIEFHLITQRFTSTDAVKEKIGAVVVHRVGNGSGYVSKMFFAIRAAKVARKLNAEKSFDGMWAMMSYMTLPVVVSRLPIPYVLTLQEGDTYEHMYQRLHILPFIPLIKIGFRGARAVSALSTFLAQWAANMGYKGAVDIVPNGADIEKFNGESIAHTGTVLVTSSRLVHKNAVDDCLRALALLPETFLLRVAGVGPLEGELRALAVELGVEGRVEWLGFVSHTDLPRVLHSADIFVRPSRSEGFGASFIEAFAAELPVIATQEGGLADFISSEVAFPVRANTPEDIAAAALDIVARPDHTQEVVKRARALAQTHYSWNTIAKDMRAVFEKLFV